jgi:uncharacterized protein
MRSYDRWHRDSVGRGHAVNSQPVLFIQGAGSMLAPQGSGRLAAHLAREVGTDYRVIAPEMPHADSPDYQSWRDRIELELAAIDDEVILVGHSFGGSVLLKYLAEGSNRKPVRGLFLVSVPDWGPDGWAYAEFAVPDDVGSRLPATRIFMYHVAMTRRCRSRISATTSSIFRRRQSGRSQDLNTRSSTGFRCSSTTSRDCLFEDQLSSAGPAVVSLLDRLCFG